MSDIKLDEQYVEKQLEADASKFNRNYGQIIDEAAETFNEAYKGHREWSLYDTVGLGNYLSSWEQFSEIFNEDAASRDQLGDYMKVGLGLN